MAGLKFDVNDIIFNPVDGGTIEMVTVMSEDGKGITKKIVPVANVGYLYRGLKLDEEKEELIATLKFKDTTSSSNKTIASNTIWKAYVKDQMNLSAKPKAFLNLLTFDCKNDLLTTANSSFECMSLPSNVSKGDVLTLLNPYGVPRYHGVITSIEETTIQTAQIQNYFAGTWVYDLPSLIGQGDNKCWQVDLYDYSEDISLKPSELEDLTVKSTRLINDTSIGMSLNYTNPYIAKCTTYVYSSSRIRVDLYFKAKQKGTLNINGTQTISVSYSDKEDDDNGAKTSSCVFRKGWNRIEVVYSNEENDSGFLLYYNSHLISQCGLFSQMTTNYSTEVNSLEEAFKTALSNYCNGVMKDSNYIDPVVKQRLSEFEITTCSNTQGGFVSQNDNYTIDMEQMIYDLYNNYQIMLDVKIPYEGTPSIKIGKSQIEEYLKVANNNNTIANISPITEIEETNRVIVYDKDGIYRTTYVTKSDGTRVEEPSEMSSRFGVVNTSIVLPF